VPTDLTIWAVVYSNYEPPEVAAMYDNEAAAQAHADDLDGPWHVVAWRVRSTYEPEQ
jgi:hypothetical protein